MTFSVEDMKTEIQYQGDVVDSILEMTRSLHSLKSLDLILDRILFEARKLTRADAGSIYLLKGQSLSFCNFHNDTLSEKHDQETVRYANMSIAINSSTIVGHCALTRQPVMVQDAYNISEDAPYVFNPTFDKKNDYKTISVLTVPLLSAREKLVGVIQLINALDGQGHVTTFTEQNKIVASLFANSAAVHVEHSVRNRNNILRMVKMSSLHDPEETGTHVMRVSAFSVEIYQRWADKQGLSEVEIKHFRDLLALASMLHDVGKVGIPDSILKKPECLSKNEFENVKRHTIHGAQIFDDISSELDKMSYEVALHHHQKWDGTGYPEQYHTDGSGEALSGEAIPLAARIVALADVFDALSSERCYKKAWKKKEIDDLFRAESGQHFDPDLVEVFFEISQIIDAIQKRFEG